MLDFASTPPRGSLGQRAFAAAERVSKCRACVVVGLAVASALCAASVTGLSRRLRVRESQDTQADYDCQRARDAVSGWGERLAFEAASLGSLMQREEQKEKEHHEQYDRYTDETHHPLPFLVPGSLTTAQLSARLEIMAAEFEQNPPAVLWSPTVQHEDRLEYEEYATRAFGRSVFITDDWALNSTLAKTPAPIRETYNPLTTLWVLPESDGSPLARLDDSVGRDIQQLHRDILPTALKKRFFEKRKLVAHPRYDQDGQTYADYVIIVLVPLVDDDCKRDCQQCIHNCSYPCRIDCTNRVLGYVSFNLHVDHWDATFPAHVRISMSTTGDVIKTEDRGYYLNANAYEPILDLDLKCFYEDDNGSTTLYVLGTVVSAALILLLLWALRRLEVGASQERKLADYERRDAVASAMRKDERTRDAFQSSEKTERYLNHELKNRIFVLGQSCSDESVLGQLDEITEVLNCKAVLMRLSAGRYEPKWDEIEPLQLIDVRWTRFVVANSPFGRAETTGNAKHRKVFLFDKVLFNIILDILLSNAFKYGDPRRPPTLSLNVEPLDESAMRVKLSLELRNWPGCEHEQLLLLGEGALNDIALTEGMCAHEHAAELSSGDGFPMAAAAAKALGGTVKLLLLEDGVCAKLELPDVAAVLPLTPKSAAVMVSPPVELSWLKIAMADDSAMFRKTFAKLVGKLTSQPPIVAGESRESIDDFPRTVVSSDVDVVLLDFNFAPVHHTKTGIDLCRECRALDAKEGNVPRVIFIVSANDTPEDDERYRAAGADGSLGKKMTIAKLRLVLEEVVRTHPRFATSSRCGAAAPRVAADAHFSTSSRGGSLRGGAAASILVRMAAGSDAAVADARQ